MTKKKKKPLRELNLFSSKEEERLRTNRDSIPPNTVVVLQIRKLGNEKWKVWGVKKDTKVGRCLSTTLSGENSCARPTDEAIAKSFKVEKVEYSRLVKWKTGFGQDTVSYIYKGKVLEGPDIPFA